MDEENIVRRMIDGDMEAFGTLMEQYEKPALRAAWLISGNAADSEDIVQETFTACYLNRKKLRDPAAFKTWFYRILTRSAWKISRKSRKEQPEEEPASGQADTGRSVLENCIMKEEERILYEAVEKLPPRNVRTIRIARIMEATMISKLPRIAATLFSFFSINFKTPIRKTIPAEISAGSSLLMHFLCKVNYSAPIAFLTVS